MFKVAFTLIVSVLAHANGNPHSDTPVSTADTPTVGRVLVSPKTNFTLSAVTTRPTSKVILELWSERMVSGDAVAPAAAPSGHRVLSGHGAAAAAPAMSYIYRLNGKLYINDQDAAKNSDGSLNYQVKIGIFDRTYTTLNGPLTANSAPPVDWSEINFSMTDANDLGTWSCNDKWTTYPAAPPAPSRLLQDAPAAMPAANLTASSAAVNSTATPPTWQMSNTLDDVQNCVIVNSFNTKKVIGPNRLFVTTQFNRLFDTKDTAQDIKMWPGMPITLLTQVTSDLTSDGSASPIQQNNYILQDFAVFDFVPHGDSQQVTIIIIVLLIGTCAIISFLYYLDHKK